MSILVEKQISPKTHKSNRQVHQVASSNKTHGSEVDPTGIEGLSNFSLVVDLVKRIKYWLSGLSLTETKLLGM